MNDCTLKNTSFRNRAIGPPGGLTQALCDAHIHLIGTAQCHGQDTDVERPKDVIEAAWSVTEASTCEIKYGGQQRIRALCNERAFAVGRRHVGHIGVHRTEPEVES